MPMPALSAWGGRVRFCGIPSWRPGFRARFRRGVCWAGGRFYDGGRVAEGRRVMLWGRRRQCGVLDGLLADVRAGRSRVLVVRGEPGIGKTALLDYAIQSASGFRVVRAAGVESEMELAFAALHQLCA